MQFNHVLFVFNYIYYVQAGVECILCEFILKELEDLLGNNKTEVWYVYIHVYMYVYVHVYIYVYVYVYV